MEYGARIKQFLTQARILWFLMQEAYINPGDGSVGGRGMEACQSRGGDGSFERDGAFLVVEGAALSRYPF